MTDNKENWTNQLGQIRKREKVTNFHRNPRRESNIESFWKASKRNWRWDEEREAILNRSYSLEVC